jgi:hypothetical protein
MTCPVVGSAVGFGFHNYPGGSDAVPFRDQNFPDQALGQITDIWILKEGEGQMHFLSHKKSRLQRSGFPLIRF